MTPLIDVVFLLVIFFLVSSHLAQQETPLEIELPEAATGAEPADVEHRRVLVNVLHDGRLVVAGQATDADRLAALLRYEVGATDTPVEVRIRADRAAEYGRVEPVFVACATAGVWNVRLAVREAP